MDSNPLSGWFQNNIEVAIREPKALSISLMLSSELPLSILSLPSLSNPKNWNNLLRKSFLSAPNLQFFFLVI